MDKLIKEFVDVALMELLDNAPGHEIEEYFRNLLTKRFYEIAAEQDVARDQATCTCERSFGLSGSGRTMCVNCGLPLGT